jgi:hypothetical protein
MGACSRHDVNTGTASSALEVKGLEDRRGTIAGRAITAGYYFERCHCRPLTLAALPPT